MEKIKIIIIAFLFLSSFGNVAAQEITNFLLVGDKGITEDIKEAHSFIVVKRLPDNRYERLDYKMHAPLIKLKTYSDSSLRNLSGRYLEYFTNGFIRIKGYYTNNVKDSIWYSYNDTGKVILKEEYSMDTLIKAENPDTIKKSEGQKFGDEREAKMKGNKYSWVNYLTKKLEYSPVAEKSLQGGEVRVGFKVDTTGKTTDIYMHKSVEFILDEESIKVIKESPLWEPAYQNGHAVNAYRIQPLTFIKQ
jgi:hypothetical protein